MLPPIEPVRIVLARLLLFSGVRFISFPECVQSWLVVGHECQFEMVAFRRLARRDRLLLETLQVRKRGRIIHVDLTCKTYALFGTVVNLEGVLEAWGHLVLDLVFYGFGWRLLAADRLVGHHVLLKVLDLELLYVLVTRLRLDIQRGRMRLVRVFFLIDNEHVIIFVSNLRLILRLDLSAKCLCHLALAQSEVKVTVVCLILVLQSWLWSIYHLDRLDSP